MYHFTQGQQKRHCNSNHGVSASLFLILNKFKNFKNNEMFILFVISRSLVNTRSKLKAQKKVTYYPTRHIKVIRTLLLGREFKARVLQRR